MLADVAEDDEGGGAGALDNDADGGEDAFAPSTVGDVGWDGALAALTDGAGGESGGGGEGGGGGGDALAALTDAAEGDVDRGGTFGASTVGSFG